MYSKMPMETDANAPASFIAPDMIHQDLTNCVSPDATPTDSKMSISLSAALFPTMPQWNENCEALQKPSDETYVCPPGALLPFPPGRPSDVRPPFPCMVDWNWQPVQFPYLGAKSQPLLWAPDSNAFHVACERNSGREESIFAAPCRDASPIAKEVDFLPRSYRGRTCDPPKEADESSGDLCTSDRFAMRDKVVALGNPRQMFVKAGFSSSVVDLLESSSAAKRAAIIAWMQPIVLDLALSAKGTRVIQKALELTGGEAQIRLSNCLQGRVGQLLDSPHGNHILQKAIVVMPPYAVQFIFHELSFFRGGWVGVARHRYGCRVVERLLEHCDAELTAPIVAAMVADFASLSRHRFANYVIQHILEYAPAHRSQIVNALIQAGLPSLAQHEMASNIVDKAFEHGSVENQQALAGVILSTSGAIVELACSRYGSFTVRRMLETVQGTPRYMALQQLGEALPSLKASKYGRLTAGRVLLALSKIDAAHA